MILHGNRLRAYLAANPGCSEISACKSASRLLSYPPIRLRINEAVLASQRKVEEQLGEQLLGQAVSVSDNAQNWPALSADNI